MIPIYGCSTSGPSNATAMAMRRRLVISVPLKVLLLAGDTLSQPTFERFGFLRSFVVLRQLSRSLLPPPSPATTTHDERSVIV